MNTLNAADMHHILASLNGAIDAIDACVPNIARREIVRVRAKLLGAALGPVAVEPVREPESVS